MKKYNFMRKPIMDINNNNLIKSFNKNKNYNLCRLYIFVQYYTLLCIYQKENKNIKRSLAKDPFRKY